MIVALNATILIVSIIVAYLGFRFAQGFVRGVIDGWFER